MSYVGRKTVVLVLLAITIGILLLAFPTTSAALPQYATATGQPCSTCHVNPAGGGTLTATGQAFAAIATHTTDPAGAFAQVSRPAAATATPAPAATATAAPAATATAAPAATATRAAATPAAAAPAATPAPTAAAGAAAALPKTGEPNWQLVLGLLAGLLLCAGIALERYSSAHR